MDKLLWVATPLLLALVCWLGLGMRGRWPSRLELNVASSLLLLIYLLATAGLGLLWVAQQQLPVFDWHYLFGYASLLLLALHLAFNLRVVVQALRRRRSTSAAPSSNMMPARRPWLATTAALLGVGVAAYLLGRRHGRVELVVAAAGEQPAGGTATLDSGLVVQLHEAGRLSRRGLSRRAASPEWALPPPAFKPATPGRRIALPPVQGLPSARVDGQPTLAQMASCLWHTVGINQRRGGLALRTSPSSGALFATELYLLAPAIVGLDGGPWHYDPDGHALQGPPTAKPAAEPALWAALGLPERPVDVVAVVLASAVFARSGHKYGDRTYRYVCADLGHALENLVIAATAGGRLQVELLSGFDDAAATQALGLADTEEAVLAAALLRRPGSTVRNLAATAPGWQAPPLHSLGGTGSASTLTLALQRATSLLPAGTSPPSSDGSLPAPPAQSQSPAARRFALPGPRALDGPVLEHIGRRRSRRRFDARPLDLQRLADLLAAVHQHERPARLSGDPPASRAKALAWPHPHPHPHGDTMHDARAPALTASVRLHVLTHAVEALPTAAWRVDPSSGMLVQSRELAASFRQTSRAAALDQDVIGDAALVMALTLDRAALARDPAGPARAWRHAFIEAGRMGERAYLAGEALGLAVCSVGAFFDDEAAALVGVDAAQEWVLHLVAIGWPSGAA